MLILPPLYTFPSFNMFSTPLLVLVLQGLLFGFLLLVRYIKKKNISDALLACILLITCYHRTTYTIGFMDWYDTYRNTKINYYLISLALILAPLLFFYVKSVTTADFKFRKQDIVHFFPWILFLMTKIAILGYDMNQPGFESTQNGPAVLNIQWEYVDPIMTLLSAAQMLLYLAFTFQLFYNYRKKIKEYFSNTYQLELNWIRNFLYVYTFIFIYGIVQLFINEFITELSWKQKWWLQFSSALIVLYVGIKGYFTNTLQLTSLNFEPNYEGKHSKNNDINEELSTEILKKKIVLQKYFAEEKPYLNPNLNLSELAKNLQMNRSELSELINVGFEQNFNDFVNSFRVKEFKERIENGAHKQLSLLGIAYDSGFNSKATFNRVFKKITHSSPTQFLHSISK